MKRRKSKKVLLLSLSTLTLGGLVYFSQDLLNISASTFGTQQSSDAQMLPQQKAIYAAIQSREESAEILLYQGFSDNTLSSRAFVATVQDELGNWSFISPSDGLENEQFNEVVLFQTDEQGKFNLDNNLMEKVENGTYKQFQLFELNKDLLTDASSIKKVDLAQEIGLDTIYYLENQDSEEIFGKEDQQAFLKKMDDKWQMEEMSLREEGMQLLAGHMYMLLQDPDVEDQEEMITIETEESSDTTNTTNTTNTTDITDSSVIENDSSKVEEIEEVPSVSSDLSEENTTEISEEQSLVTSEEMIETTETSEEVEVLEETISSVDMLEEELESDVDSSNMTPVFATQTVSDPFTEGQKSYQLVVAMESPAYEQYAPEVTADELYRWVKKAEIVDKSTQDAVDVVKDYSVRLIDPMKVDMNAAGIEEYEVEVSVLYEGEIYTTRETVKVNIVASDEDDTDGKGEGETPPPTTPPSTPPTTPPSTPPLNELPATPTPVPSSTTTTTPLPQLNEQSSWITAGIGLLLVGLSFLGFRKRELFDK